MKFDGECSVVFTGKPLNFIKNFYEKGEEKDDTEKR